MSPEAAQSPQRSRAALSASARPCSCSWRGALMVVLFLMQLCPPLAQSSEMPFEELLALYGYEASDPISEQDSESNDIAPNLPDMTLDKVRAALPACLHRLSRFPPFQRGLKGSAQFWCPSEEHQVQKHEWKVFTGEGGKDICFKM